MVIFLFALLFLTSCDLRTSSKNRLEQISDVKLADDFEVLKDEYQDMGPDYCILYNIKFNKTASSEFIENIRNSRFYKQQSNILKAKYSNTKTDTLPVWYKSNEGYVFRYKKGLTDYTIDFNVSNQSLNYQEGAD